MRHILALLLLALTVCTSPAFAQSEKGGLEAQTPNPAVRAPGDVQLYVPYDDKVIGRVSIPDDKLATLVQPEGRTWRAFRSEWLTWIAAALMIGTTALLTVFFLWRGRIRVMLGFAGRWVPRFNIVERFIHWTTALSFLTLALSGLIITFGRPLLIPLIGHENFTPLANSSKYLHNFSSVPFVFGILVMLVLWIKDNIPDWDDLDWLRHGGGMFSKHGSYHPEASRFNAGQKGIFWTVVLGGLAMAVTGYMLMTPFAFTGIGGMQILHVIHALLSAFMIAVIIAHIYIGTLGMEGAFDAMGRGEVDENWAIEHHRRWYDEQHLANQAIPDDNMGRHRAGAD